VDELLADAAMARAAPRHGTRHPVRRLIVLYNQMMHIHVLISKLCECYRGEGLTSEHADSLAARDALRFWAHDQAQWAIALSEARRNLTAATGVAVELYYRTTGAASCDYFCEAPNGAPRTPVHPAAVAAAVMRTGTTTALFSHQYVYWANDVCRAAFTAQGFEVLDHEGMLSVRPDAHPASFNGTGDKLHFCQPGPADWALDAAVRRIAR